MRNKEYNILGFIKVRLINKAIELYDYQIEYNKTYYLWNIPVYSIKLSEIDSKDLIVYDPRKPIRMPYCLKSKHPELVQNK